LPFTGNSQTDSNFISKFINNVALRNKNSARQYQSRLSFFERFAKEYYKDNKSNVDTLLQQLKDRELDPYFVLNEFCIFLKNNNNCTGITFKNKIITVKTFLEYNDVEISPRKFKLKVRFPKSVLKHKEALDKNDIVQILNGCSDIKLKTYVMLLAVTGARAVEALSIRLKDLDLESNPAKLSIRGEFTKTKVDRHIFITKELKEQLIKWINFKYRKRRICYKNPNEKTITEYRTPEKDTNELLFSIYRIENPNPEILYSNTRIEFAKTIDRLGLGEREDEGRNENSRREITLHSFRRFCKSTISGLGFQDYSEYHIGHSGSTYWRKKDSEKAALFKKIEPYLTFLDIQQLERKGADMETQMAELQEVNQILRNREQIREERDRKAIERLTKLEEKFDILTAKFNTERQQSRDYENTSFDDWDAKESKFQKYLKTQRERMKQETDLINSVKKQEEEGEE
jgi:integrase